MNRLKSQLKYIIEGKDEYLKAIDTVDEYIVELIKPRFLDANSPRNEIIRQKVDFENLCIVLMKNGIQEPDKMSVMRFYSTIKVFEREKR